MDKTSGKVIDLLANITSSPDKTAYTRDEVIAMLKAIVGLSDSEEEK